MILISILFKFIEILNNFYNFINFVINVLFNILKTLTQLLIKYFSFVFKFSSLLLLLYSVICVTFDYFSYPYIYSLIVSDNNRGFDLPAISLCTERNVFFDKTKVNHYLNLTEKYRRIQKQSEILYKEQFEDCLKVKGAKDVHKCDRVMDEMINNLSLFYRPYEKDIREFEFR